MSIEQRWLVAMWAKIYTQYCAPTNDGAPPCLLSVPDSGGLLPTDEYFLNEPVGEGGPDLERLQGNANFAYATNFVPHFAGESSAYATVWDAYARVFGQIDQRQAKFGLPADLVGTPAGETIERQRPILLDMLTAPDMKPYRETALSVPGSLFEPSTPWTEISVRAAEVEQVLATAPGFLKRMFGLSGANSSAPADEVFEEISFELATATIVRPWLELSQLCNGLWDWILPGVSPLSDGANPPQGSLPAIPERVVFVRNVEVTLKAAGKSDQTQTQVAVDKLSRLPFMAATVRPKAAVAKREASVVERNDSVVLKPWLLSKTSRADLAKTPGLQATAIAALSTKTTSKTKAAPVVLTGVTLSPKAVATLSPQTVISAKGAASVPLAQTAQRAAAPTVNRKIVATAASSVAKTAIPARRLIDASAPKIGGVIVKPVQPTLPNPPKPTSPPTQPTSHTLVGFRAVQILAFLCRPLPRLPNPTPGLVF